MMATRNGAVGSAGVKCSSSRLYSGGLCPRRVEDASVQERREVLWGEGVLQLHPVAGRCFGGGGTTHGVQDKIRMLSNGFYELGMKPGDSVLTWTDNRSETLASFYACAMTGIRCVTVDPSIKEADVLV